MKAFAALFAALDASTRTNDKVAALAEYFRAAPDRDRLWTLALFTGRRPRRVITATALRQWAAEAADIPDWLFEDSYAVTGDLAETVALLLPPPETDSDLGLAGWIDRLRDLSRADDATRKAGVLAAWAALPAEERFLFIKLLTGGFRVGVSAKLAIRALAQVLDLPEADLTLRLTGDWSPERVTWDSLIAGTGEGAAARPYPFFLAYALDGALPGDPSDWFAEWKWDGIRAQAVRRADWHLWSRGDDLITDRFPDLGPLADFLPRGTVLDGEILAWDGTAPLPFARLQTRIGRKVLTKKALAEAPALFMAYDLLEREGRDLRGEPFAARRAALETLVATLPASLPLRLSPPVPFASMADLAAARAMAPERKAEGLMLKRKDSAYGVGRKTGDWWKWKVDPITVDAVMIYAQAGHGRRANLFTDFTFAVRDGGALVPFAKAYSGLTDAEFAEITAWVRANTLQRWGPVRQVPPEQVFELAFEGIQQSTRHKSGIALRFPRILRWRRDKPVAEIDTLTTLRALAAAQG